MVVEQVHQLLVVACVKFDQHGVRTGGEMALNDFGNGLKLFDNLLVHAAALKVEAYISAGRLAQAFGVGMESAARDDAFFHQMLYALMDGGTRNAALRGHILEGNARVS